MRRIAKAHRQTRNHHIHRNARLGACRSAAMTFGITAVLASIPTLAQGWEYDVLGLGSGSIGDTRKLSTSRSRPRAFNPHSLRNTLVQLAYELRLDAERFKAWSQNLGHEGCLTTFSSYGKIPPARQAEMIRGLSPHGEGSNHRAEPALLRKLADDMERAPRA